MEDATIDILSKAEPFPKMEYVIAIRLDFTRSMELHSTEYARYELVATLAAVLIELFQAIVLLRLLGRAALRPVGLISSAMESVAHGNLDARIEHNSGDEFGTMAERFNEMARSLREKEMLARYVSRSTIDMVQSSVGNGSSFKEPYRIRRTVLFSDIRGFTRFSEGNKPEMVIRILNRILDIQAAVITHAGGKIDKFVGDEIMATFDDPRAAALAALKIANLLTRAGDEFCGLQVGIGISEGEVVEGDVGIESHKDFTVIGDVVNTAARLQSMAGPGQVLAPLGIMDLPEMGIFRFSEEGFFAIKGKQEKLPVARIFGIKPEAHRRK
jgi:class 3 adenylate cyclase